MNVLEHGIVVPFYKNYSLQKKSGDLFFLQKTGGIRMKKRELKKHKGYCYTSLKLKGEETFLSESIDDATQDDSFEWDVFEADDFFGIPHKEVAKSLGLSENDGQLEIEALLNYTDESGKNTILDFLLSNIVYKGVRYHAGDRVEIPLNFNGNTISVELREMKDDDGVYLRAVVIGIYEEYQCLSTKKVLELYDNSRHKENYE